MTIVNTADGRPFTVAGFGRFMRDAIQVAGLPLECQPHGLRKAAGRRLAESGCTAKEIMSILGHQTLSETEKCIEEADQAGLAEAAIAKFEGQNWNKLAQTQPKGLGKADKTSKQTT